MLGSCVGQMTCTVIPPTRGVVIVYGQWNGYTFGSEYLQIKAARAELQLECTATVTRGGTGTCTAKTTSDPNFQVTQWKFASADGRVEVTPVDPAQNVSREWSGQMVLTGTVTVTAQVSGQTQTATAQITVGNRDWTDREPQFSFVRAADNDPRMRLSNIVLTAGDLGIANFFARETPTAPAPDYTAEVPSGPNEGIDYFSNETTIRFWGRFQLNTLAMAPGSGFYAAQERGGHGGTQLGGLRWCPPSIVPTQLPELVELHERKHGSAYAAALARAFPAEATKLEQFTSLNVVELDEEYDRAWRRLDAIARPAARAIHEQPGGLIAPTYQGRPCALKNERGVLLPNDDS
jgi:hypothetical protein